MTANEIKAGTLCELNDECPVHGAELKGEYNFGMRDAKVETYRCGCATVTTELSSMDGGGYYYPTYNEAAGCARLQSAMNSVRHR